MEQRISKLEEEMKGLLSCLGMMYCANCKQLHNVTRRLKNEEKCFHCGNWDSLFVSIRNGKRICSDCYFLKTLKA